MAFVPSFDAGMAGRDSESNSFRFVLVIFLTRYFSFIFFNFSQKASWIFSIDRNFSPFAQKSSVLDRNCSVHVVRNVLAAGMLNILLFYRNTPKYYSFLNEFLHFVSCLV